MLCEWPGANKNDVMDRRMMSTVGNGRRVHRTMERAHQVTRNTADGRGGWGQSQLGKSKISKTGRPGMQGQGKDKAGQATRTRPTNNQLQYKAYFRWQHYPMSKSLVDGELQLASETDAYPSVTAAFLQVLHYLQDAESIRASKPRNILKILAKDTRHTKVVDLASATHRVSEELKRHCLVDAEGQQYTTNLDRNRYGNDDQYMFTVIRHNLCLMDLCPCLVDVEVLDQKSNESILVSAGVDACMCQKDQCEDEEGAGLAKASGALSGSERFDALIEAATRNTAANDQNDNPRSPPNNNMSGRPLTKSKSVSGQRSKHQVSTGCEVDSLQHAIAAFRAEPCFTDLTHNSSKRQMQKRSFSSLHPSSKILDGSLSDMWGPPETVEDNVKGMVNAEKEGGQLQDTATATGVKREREPEEEEQVHWQQRKLRIGKQSSSVGPRTANAAEIKRLQAEVSSLTMEKRRIREELTESRRDQVHLRKEFENDRNAWRQLEGQVRALQSEVHQLIAERKASEEKKHMAESQVVVNRQVINILLNRLQQVLMQSNTPINGGGPGNHQDTNGASAPVTPLNHDHSPLGNATSPAPTSTTTTHTAPLLTGMNHVQLPSNIMLALADQPVAMGALQNQLGAGLVGAMHQHGQKSSPQECVNGRGGPPGAALDLGGIIGPRGMGIMGGVDQRATVSAMGSGQLQVELPGVVIHDVDQIRSHSHGHGHTHSHSHTLVQGGGHG